MRLVFVVLTKARRLFILFLMRNSSEALKDIENE